MSLKIPCGVGGQARIVKTCSVTGEVTHDTGVFNNVWTNAGINYLSGYAVKSVYWPNRIIYGSGVHGGDHKNVTAMAQYVGIGGTDYTETATAQELTITPETCTFTRTRSITVAARGVPWVLSELGLGRNNNTTLTYTPTKNSAGEVEGVPVSAIEIVTIYYTIQVTYPMELPPQQMSVEGLPPTTAVFKLKPLGSAMSVNFLRHSPASAAAGDSIHITDGFTSESFAGRVSLSTTEGNARRFNINTLNRSTEFFGSNNYGANHIWQLDPPIVKNNTQILDIEEYWQFSNVPVVEV